MDRHEELMRTTTTTALLDGLYDVQDGVVWRIEVLVNGGLELSHAKRREESILDSVT